MDTRAHNHYFRSVKGLEYIDVYRIIELFEVTCPAAQHILKKALAAGKRGAKDQSRDMQDIIDTATRWQEMRREDGVTPKAEHSPVIELPCYDPMKSTASTGLKAKTVKKIRGAR